MSESPSWSHLDAAGRSCMVDVGDKAPTRREAIAEARVLFPEAVFRALLDGGLPKGGVQEPARLAGIQAAKRTSEWIPLCHPLPLELVEVELEPEPDRLSLRIRCRARATARTGVEMEALVGASAAALCIYDMTKALDKGVTIQELRLLRKSGGRSGVWESPSAALPRRKP